MPSIQPGQAARREALAPEPHGVDGAARLSGDLLLGYPLCQPQNDVSPLDIGCRQGPCPTSRLKFGTFIGGNGECCHAPDHTALDIRYQCYNALAWLAGYSPISMVSQREAAVTDRGIDRSRLLLSTGQRMRQQHQQNWRQGSNCHYAECLTWAAASPPRAF